jgi:Ras-related protein Rab-6A
LSLKSPTIFGAAAVGKTSVVTRFIYDSFDVTYQATVGIDFFSKILTVDERVFRLQLWDTAVRVSQQL